MIVNDLYIRRTVRRPAEANPVLVVDTNAIKSMPSSSESLKSITRRNPQVVESFNGIKLIQLASDNRPKGLRASSASGFGVASVEEILGSLVGEGLNHLPNIAWIPCYGNTSALSRRGDDHQK